MIDDPLLLLRTRPDGRHLLFDCGQVHHLAKRLFTRLDAVFISHAHMDHWMGIDAVVRQLIAADKTVDIFGAAGLADKFDSKLRGYDWNLAEEYWSRFRVHEIGCEHLESYEFSGREGFSRAFIGRREIKGGPVYVNRFVEVLAATCDHRVASLIYRINERPAYRIDRERLRRLNLKPGKWLGELKHLYLDGREWPATLQAETFDGEGSPVSVDDPAALAGEILNPGVSRSVGYVCDVGFSTENRTRIVELMTGVDLFCCECTFLSEGKDRARASWHLCADDVNALLADIRPGFFLPMHLSRSYSRRYRDLYRQIRPPQGTTVLELPLRLTPRPLTAGEVGWQTGV